MKKPILISPDTIALVSIYKRQDDLETYLFESAINDCRTVEAMLLDYEMWNESAKRYLDVLDGNWCITFLDNLIIEAIKLVKEHSKEYNPDFMKTLIELIQKEIPEVKE